ncbi:unnamed protein product [Adineta ricciae]|uniref:Uncharacterized protein n=1 Tax=Adineta ricciae TaxID=249248 RepID=A0A815L714_ADIRI|nr:unnamed protein product [Adineta ricciae]
MAFFLIGGSITLTLVVLLILLLTYYVYNLWTNNIFRRLGIPAPTPIPFLGEMFQIMRKGVHKNDVDLSKKYGKIVGVFEGTTPIILISDPEILRNVLIKDSHVFVNRRIIEGAAGALEHGLTVLKDEQWKNARSIVSPAFSSAKLKAMYGLINEISNIYNERLLEYADKQEIFDIKVLNGQYTLDNIASCLFGVETNSLQNENGVLIKHLKKFFTVSFANIFLIIIFLVPGLAKYLGKKGYSFLPRDAMEYTTDLVSQVLSRRREGLERRNDFIQMMIDHEEEVKNETATTQETEEQHGDGHQWKTLKKTLSDKEILAQALLFLIAGYETTSVLMSFFFYVMATQPQIQEKVYDELRQIVGDDELTYEKLHELHYLDMAINETLRMYTPFIRTDRVASQDYQLGNYLIPKGSIINASIYPIHHDSKIWPDPEKFIPERFLPSEKAKRHPVSFIPFGEGPRNCIGMRFALVEAKLGIAQALRVVEFQSCEKTEIPIKLGNLGLLNSNRNQQISLYGIVKEASGISILEEKYLIQLRPAIITTMISFILCNSFSLTLFVVFILVLAYYVYDLRTNNIFRRLGMPSPPPIPVLGEMYNAIRKGMYANDVDLVRKYGKVIGIHEGTVPVILLSDPDLLRKVLIKDSHVFMNRRTLDGAGGILEHGLTSLKDEHWKNARSIVSPTFSTAKLKSMFGLMNEVSEIYKKRLLEYADKQETFDIKQLNGEFTLDNITTCLFGVQTNSLEEENGALIDHLKKFFSFSLANLFLLIFFISPRLARRLGNNGYSVIPRDTIRYLTNLMNQILDRRRQHLERRNDFIQLLIDREEQVKHEEQQFETNKKSLSNNEILGQAAVFLVAGYETTSVLMSFFFYVMATHPQIQEKVYDEIQQVIPNNEVTYEKLSELHYLDMVISETLRMYPPFTRFERVASTDYQLGDYRIPKGIVISVPVYPIHHDPQVWPEPEKFIPERFSTEEKGKRDAMSYLPFGDGPRNCVGMRFALLETKLGIVKALRVVEIGRCEKTEIPVQLGQTTTLSPKNCVIIRAVRR